MSFSPSDRKIIDRFKDWGRLEIGREVARTEHDLAVAVAEATTARAERDALSARLQAVRDGGLTFTELQRVSVARCLRWHGPDTEPWSGADWSNAMCGEAGEAANVVKKLRRIETGTGAQDQPSVDDLHLALGDELADVICYAVLVAHHYGLDLGSAVVSKFNRVSEREGFPERLDASWGTPGDEKPQPSELTQDALDQTLMDLNERGETPVVIGLDRFGHPFLAYGWAPGGDGWAAAFVNDDPHSGEFDYNDGTERCQECGAFERRDIEKLAYPVRLLSPVESSGSAE